MMRDAHVWTELRKQYLRMLANLALQDEVFSYLDKAAPQCLRMLVNPRTALQDERFSCSNKVAREVPQDAGEPRTA
jgi:hypothetical protein